MAKKQQYDYAVIAIFSFDLPAQIFPCHSHTAAKEKLREFFEAEVKADEDNGWGLECQFSEDWQYAKIIDHCPNGVIDTKEWRVGVLCEPMNT